MAGKKSIASRVFLILALLCFIGAVYTYVDTYYLRSQRTVKNSRDPRWRVFDFHSRQATEGEIYSVAEIPAVRRVREVAPRRLRFEFIPQIKAKSWKVFDASDGRLVSEGAFPEIPFPDQALNAVFQLVPEGVTLMKDIRFHIDYYPKEGYNQKGLSWPDNYWLEETSVPFMTQRPYSIDEWVGLQANDPELIEARKILGDTMPASITTIEKSERVFRFVMAKMKDADGTPTDKVQAASPLETYNLFCSGEGKGWCENKALVYYLFANAAGVKTRLIDIAGKFGPLKLTGHYFCETWLPEEGAWCYVDPQTSTANIADSKGRHVNTLQLMRLFELNAFRGTTIRLYDKRSAEIISQTGEEFNTDGGVYFTGYPVIAFKFGYGAAKSYSKLKNFVFYPTLLYSKFPVPKLYRIKLFFLSGFVFFLILSAVIKTATIIKH